MAQPIPQTAQTFIIGSDVEDVEDEGMMTAPEEDMIYNSLRSANPSATHIQLRQTSLVLDKYRNRTPMQMAINFKNITEVYRALVQNEFIEPLKLEAIQQRINSLTSASNQQTKDQLRKMISSQHDKDVYKKFINHGGGSSSD